MASVLLDGVPTTFHRSGSGPVVVVPALNLEWSDYPLEPLLERFTVVTVSPRGFLGSGRLADAAYSGEQVTSDIRRVLDHLDVETYAALGYSLNGAVASSLALGNPQVSAVVCGGFPTAASYAGLAASRRQQLAERRSDPVAWAATLEALDPAALLAFWEFVDALPSGRLATGPVCPVWSWWGGA
ncbi:MAG: alpha/beta fold hydrolase, partial [Lapillicoccus sp.]